MFLQSAEEVGLSDALSPGISRASGDFGPLLETLGGDNQGILRFCLIAVVGRGCDIVGLFVDGDHGREVRGAGSHLLLVALALLLVQGCDWRERSTVLVKENQAGDKFRGID